MITRSHQIAKRLRNGEIGSPTVKHMISFFKRIGAEEAGITALETAIILIAFVVVASVFAFTMLSAGTFSTQRGKETIYAGLTEVQSSMEVKGGIIAKTETKGTEAEITELIFTLANALNGQAINLDSEENAVLVFEYRDDTQRVALTYEDWDVQWLGAHDNDGLLEAGELAEITVTLPEDVGLGINTSFVIEVKPPSGAVLNLQRTTPAYLELVNDLN